jgi:hypothetical protein
VEALRLVNGRAGFGVTEPGFRVDVLDRIRLRQGTSASAGLWLFQSAPNEDRAFIGMSSDSGVGLWGDKGAGWGLTMDVTTGNVGIRQGPEPAGGPALAVNGRIRDGKLRTERHFADAIEITSLTDSPAWSNMPGMNISLFSPGNASYMVRFEMAGVQGYEAARAHGEFRLLVDGGQQAYAMNEYHNNGWELRSVSLQRLLTLGPGLHTLNVQWSIRSPDARPQQGFPPLIVIPAVTARLRGCWFGDSRTLTAIEL